MSLPLCFYWRTVNLLLLHLVCHCSFFVTIWLSESLATGLIDLAVCYYTNLTRGFAMSSVILFETEVNLCPMLTENNLSKSTFLAVLETHLLNIIVLFIHPTKNMQNIWSSMSYLLYSSCRKPMVWNHFLWSWAKEGIDLIERVVQDTAAIVAKHEDMELKQALDFWLFFSSYSVREGMRPVTDDLLGKWKYFCA